MTKERKQYSPLNLYMHLGCLHLPYHIRLVKEKLSTESYY